MDRTETDFPQGDGLIDCPECRGRGVVVVPKAELPAYALPGVTQFCRCVRKRDLMDNLRRGWRPLTKVVSAERSPLMGKHKQNLWIRSPLPDIKQHLRAVAVRQSPRWRFRVITDSDLMTTWLYSANEVHDADVAQARVRAENTDSRISDLVEPWDLLIIRLGVKAARNSATAEVFMEALLHREQADLPTWVVDSPGWPLRAGHLAWDERVQEFLEEFEFIEIGAVEVPQVRGSVPVEFGIDTEPAFAPSYAGDDEVEDLLDSDGHIRVAKRDWRK